MKPMHHTSNAFAEVIESTLSGWVAQSWHWHTFPTFGGLVTIQDNNLTHVGIVQNMQTGSSDPSRTPIPYQKTHEELLREQPQIFAFLKTTFTCIPVGHINKGSTYYHLPPHPPKIHAFVQHAELDLAKMFFANQSYLPLLFSMSSQILYLDELLLALLKQQAALGVLSQERITAFIETIALLTGNDYRRMKLFLQRVQPIVSQANSIGPTS